MIVNKQIIARNFSRCAHLYDGYADIQRIAALRLAEQLPTDGITNILEIGCGTGIYTACLKERFPEAYIEALDISARMTEVAQGKLRNNRINFLAADAEDAELKSSYDLVTSNAAFQWFEDLAGAVDRYKGALTKDGSLIFSMFGPDTFRELKEMLKKVLGTDASVESDNFLTGDDVEEVLKRRFRTVAVKELILKEKYPSLSELLKNIKYTGARGGGAVNKLIWRRTTLGRIDEIYKARFGSISATYQIFFCEARQK